MKYNFSNKHQKKNAQRLVIMFLLVASLFTFVIPIASASHGATVSFDAGTYTYDAPSPVITVTDSLAAGTVTVTVTSDIDPVGATLVLTETGFGTGVFDNSATPSPLFMDGDNKFPLESTRTINLDDPTSDITGTPDTVTVPVLTSSSVGDTTLDLIETGDNTGLFEGIITFSATGPSTGPASPIIVQITAGETFSVLFPCAGASNGQITPIPGGSTIGAVRANVGNTITVTYVEADTTVATDSATLETAGGCGGGGGGLIISPVIQVLAGGTAMDRTPPLLAFSKEKILSLPGLGDILNNILGANPFTILMPVTDPQFDPPLVIDDKAFVISQYANTIPTIMHDTGDPMQLTLNLFDSTGVEHIALYTNLRGNAREVSDSNTYIIYDEDKPLQIVDPEGYFYNVNFTESNEGTKYKITYDITFAKPMDTSDIIIRTWDPKRNSGDIKIFDAIKITGNSIVKPGVNNLIQAETSSISIPYYKFPEYAIPIAGSGGNIIYYNSFGGIEEKQIHPYHEPTAYPHYVGRSERHDDGFQQTIIQEDIKAQTIAQELIGNPFTASEDSPTHVKFFYPSNVGKLDREKEDTLTYAMVKEHLKATKIYSKLYRTNHLED